MNLNRIQRDINIRDKKKIVLKPVVKNEIPKLPVKEELDDLEREADAITELIKKMRANTSTQLHELDTIPKIEIIPPSESLIPPPQLVRKFSCDDMQRVRDANYISRIEQYNEKRRLRLVKKPLPSLTAKKSSRMPVTQGPKIITKVNVISNTNSKKI